MFSFSRMTRLINIRGVVRYSDKVALPLRSKKPKSDKNTVSKTNYEWEVYGKTHVKFKIKLDKRQIF